MEHLNQQPPSRLNVHDAEQNIGNSIVEDVLVGKRPLYKSSGFTATGIFICLKNHSF